MSASLGLFNGVLSLILLLSIHITGISAGVRLNLMCSCDGTCTAAGRSDCLSETLAQALSTAKSFLLVVVMW